MKNKTVNLKLIYITAHSAGLIATQIKSVEVRLVSETQFPVTVKALGHASVIHVRVN
jgi:hypothetical protein